VTIGWLLHWAFAREKVHLARPEGMAGALWNPSRSGSDSTLTIGGGGMGGGSNLGFAAPADAYAVHRAVKAQGGVAKVIQTYAMMGVDARPDWTPHPVITVERGKTGYAHEIIRPGKYRLCPFRLFRYRGDLPEIVDQRRRVYSDWAETVRAVHEMLRAPGQLSAHRLVADVPPVAPWTG